MANVSVKQAGVGRIALIKFALITAQEEENAKIGNANAILCTKVRIVASKNAKKNV
jgi:hypothetical protein